MRDEFSVSATVVDGAFVWATTGEPTPLPVTMSAPPVALPERSAHQLTLVGHGLIAMAALTWVAWSLATLPSSRENSHVLVKLGDEPIVTGSIEPSLRSTIGTDDDERAKALARAAALTSRRDEVGRRAIDMMCTACGAAPQSARSPARR